MTCPLRDARVQEIVVLMSAGEWLMKRSQRRDLAAKWGVQVSTVRDYATDAHRLLAYDPDERAQFQDALMARMLEIAERAKTTISTMSGMPDFRAEIDAIRLAGEYFGIKAGDAYPSKDNTPERIDFTIAVEPEAHDDTAREAPAGSDANDGGGDDPLPGVGPG